MVKATVKTGSAREAILDSAEELFAQKGFDGVPVREVAKHAGVNLSLVTYHFASKDLIFDEVLGRRSHEINAMRAELLDSFLADQSKDLRRLIEAYTMPFLVRMGSGDPKWRNYGELISQLAHSPKYSGLIKKYYDGIAKRYARALSGIFDNTSPELAIRSLVFSISVLMGAMAAVRRVESLSDTQFSTERFHVTHPLMVEFICCGIKGIMSQVHRNSL